MRAVAVRASRSGRRDRNAFDLAALLPRAPVDTFRGLRAELANHSMGSLCGSSWKSAGLGRHLGVCGGALFKLVPKSTFSFLRPVSRPDPRGCGRGLGLSQPRFLQPRLHKQACRGLHSRDDFFRHFLEVRDFVETDDITYLNDALLAPGQWQCKRLTRQTWPLPRSIATR
jgi:hypothetical protein